jgi:sulfonate transport system substrate-binding protein
VLQDRKVYREAFNLHARATDLADPEKRRSIVAFVRAVAEASKALKKDPKPYLPHISSVIGFSPEEISWGWPETEFPVEIIPGHARCSRDGRGMGRQNKQSGSAKP